jgi:hypothetical protein
METAYVIWSFGLLIGIIMAYYWYDKNKADKHFDDTKKSNNEKFKSLDAELRVIANKQTEHDNKFVTDDRVRVIVKSEIQPIKEDLRHVKEIGERTRADVQTMMSSVQDLVTEFKIRNAFDEWENKQKGK